MSFIMRLNFEKLLSCLDLQEWLTSWPAHGQHMWAENERIGKWSRRNGAKIGWAGAERWAGVKENGGAWAGAGTKREQPSRRKGFWRGAAKWPLTLHSHALARGTWSSSRLLYTLIVQFPQPQAIAYYGSSVAAVGNADRKSNLSIDCVTRRHSNRPTGPFPPDPTQSTTHRDWQIFFR